MRNIFDQFDQEENRLTHGLATALAVDRGILKDFARWLTDGQFLTSRSTKVVQQSIPGIPLTDVPSDDRKGLPDLCLYDDDRCLAIEVKAAAKLSADQLKRHQRTLGRHFPHVQVAAITADPIDRQRFPKVLHRTWQDVYTWLGEAQRRQHFWCAQLREFMRILESNWIPQEYGMRTPLTTFDGIPFGADSPYSYREAKLLIKQVMPLLRDRPTCQALGVHPQSEGRAAITGRDGDFVWDFLSLAPTELADNFTTWPHATLGIHRTKADAMITIPNGIKSSCRSAIQDLGEEGFLDLCSNILKNYRKTFSKIPSAKPMIVVVQRHFLGQKKAIVDGDLQFDLRTALGDPKSGVKAQRAWIGAAYQLATKREGANLQLQFGVWFDYTGATLRTKDNALAAIEGAWASCRPVVDLLLNDPTKQPRRKR